MRARKVVVLEGVDRTFGGDPPVRALRGVRLSIERAEFCLLQGPSGSGKSTLLSLVGGLDVASGGSVRVMDVELTGLPAGDLAGFRLHHVGFVFQDFRLIEALTARENVEVPLSLGGMGRRERRAEAGALLERLGLGSRLDARPGALSGGEKQRVALARALARRPPIVLADEPTAHLDAATGAEVVDLLREAASGRGTTVVVSTHDPRLARHADRVLRIQDGVIGC